MFWGFFSFMFYFMNTLKAQNSTWMTCEQMNAANCAGHDRGGDEHTGMVRALRARWQQKPEACGLWVLKCKLGHFFFSFFRVALRPSSFSFSTGRGANCTRETRSSGKFTQANRVP